MIQDFFTLLSVCHTIIPEEGEGVQYNAAFIEKPSKLCSDKPLPGLSMIPRSITGMSISSQSRFGLDSGGFVTKLNLIHTLTRIQYLARIKITL